MRINVTMLRDFLKCPQYAWNMHVLFRGPDGPAAVSLDVGRLFHEGMEARMKGTKLMPIRYPSWVKVRPEAREKFEKHKLWLPINAFAPETDWRIEAVEVALADEMGMATLQGRLDAIIKWNGKFWSLQWKTYEGDLLGLQERVRLSWHEAAYQYLAEQNAYKPWGGTILGACEKLPGYRLIGEPKKRVEVTDEDRIGALTFHYLARSQRQQMRIMQDVYGVIQDMHRVLAGGAVFSPQQFMPRNYDTCFGPYGRSRCPYFAACHEGANIMEPPFVQLEPRYEQEEA